MIDRDTGDVVDRLTIAMLKSERVHEPENEDEVYLFTQFLQEKVVRYPHAPFGEMVNLMKQVNGMIWDIEAETRRTALGKNPFEVTQEELAKVGMETMFIRRFNAIRVGLKQLINVTVGEELGHGKSVQDGSEQNPTECTGTGEESGIRPRK